MNRVQKVSCRMDEQETNIVIDPVSKTASVFSSIPSTINQLYKLVEANPEASIELDSKYGLMITVPMKWVKIKPPKKCSYSDEQLQAMKERLQKAKEAAKRVAL